jgi:hypothetical protein
MKLSKDDIQKLILGGLLLIGLIYCYFTMLLQPLKSDYVIAQKNLVEIEPQIAEAKAQISQAEAVEKDAPRAQATIAQIEAMIPEGSPVAWFPPRIAEFFKARHVDKVATRMNNEFVEKDLPGFRRMSWAIDLPKVNFGQFAGALAQLENDEPLLEINNLLIETTREDAESQRALITASNLVKQ